MKAIEIVKSILKSNIYAYSLLRLLGRDSVLMRRGWFKSYKTGMPVDADNNPLPWYTYPAIWFLEPRVNKTMSVYEFGAGNSTLWWASKVKDVLSVENDERWAGLIRKSMPPNAALVAKQLEPVDGYTKHILDFEDRFEIIVIDGRRRNECAKNSLKALKPDGVIVWDNGERERYGEGFGFLAANGFKRIDFTGMVPGSCLEMITVIFYRTDNCLGI